ncbi:MAG: hypothetical protein PHU46_13125 [Rhodocyclaceae bacterium]|nr:hypothetical protein [Rhodocyclaceae bacterium]
MNAATPAVEPSLEILMNRVETLRALCRQRAGASSQASALAAEGREIAPGLYLAERRFPLWYLRRPPAHDKVQSLPLCPGQEAALPALLALYPALLDDGGSRLFLTGVGRVQDGQFLLRQAFATTPGAEPALLAWLERELGPGGAVLCADGRGKAILMDARQRHGRSLILPWTWSAARQRYSRRPMAPNAWRELMADAALGRRILHENRNALLSLAKG